MNAVLFVNYKGRPWMKGLLENHALFLSLFVCIAGVAGCAWGISPTFNAMIHLHEFPNDEFRWKTMGLVMMTIIGPFIWDRLIIAIFAPNIMRAMVDEAKTTTMADLMPIFKTLGKVFGGLMLLGSGNIFLWGGAAWFYFKKKKEAQLEM